MNRIKKFITTVISIYIFSSVITSPLTVSAWGDSAGGRESHSIQEINENNPFGNTPVFNTIEVADTDYEWHKNYFGKEIPKTTITHEKNFVGARKDTGVNDVQTNVWDGNQITAEDGETYVIRLYAHNNNPNGEQAVAENTKVSFVGLNDKSTLQEVDVVDETGKATGEKAMKQQIEVNGLISSSNASPQEYWDYVNFQSDVPFHLEYVYGSALLENNGFASVNNIYNVPGGGNGSVQLSDDIVDKADEGGVLIGFYDLDGRIPGGYKYTCYIGIRVKVVYDYEFTIENQVRSSGTKEWSKTVEAKVGDKVDFQIQYKNTSDKKQFDVIVKDTLPSNLRYVPGTIKIKNGSHPDGDTVNGDSLVTGGLQVGNYGANSNVYLMFTAEVVDDDLAEGSNTLVNWAQAMVGETVNQDYARVVLYKKAMWFKIISTTLSILIAICLIAIAILQYMSYKKRYS